MTPYSPKTLLVTGGAGFIGANFVHWLNAHDLSTRIVTLDALTYAGRRENLEGLADPARHRFVEGDICERALIEQLLEEEAIDTVVHFAAESHVDRSISDPDAFMRTNVMGTYSLLEACRRVWIAGRKLGPESCRFHHVSTDEVYGALGPDDPAFTEETAYAPNSPYSASKAASDHVVRAYYRTYNLGMTTTNCSNNYGPLQNGEKLIPTVIRACAEGTPIPVYGDGSNVRDWLYVEDHCIAIDAVLRGGRLGETYNIGGREELSNLDLVRAICRVMDDLRPRNAPHDRLIEFVKDRPGHDWRYAIDDRKIASELGWQPAENLESGLHKTVSWYLANPERLATQYQRS